MVNLLYGGYSKRINYIYYTMKTYDKQYIKDCILNKKVIPPIIRKEIYIKILKSITNRNENFIYIALENYISNNYNIDDSIMEKIILL